jgi:hypothetical protein
MAVPSLVVAQILAVAAHALQVLGEQAEGVFVVDGVELVRIDDEQGGAAS